MPSTLAVPVVVVVAEATSRAFPHMTGLPRPQAFVALRSKPHRCLLAILGKSPQHLLDLYQLADKRRRRIWIAVIGKQDGTGSQLAGNLSDRCESNKCVVAEPEGRLSLDAVTADHEAAVSKLMAYSLKRLCERLTQVLAGSARCLVALGLVQHLRPRLS